MNTQPHNILFAVMSLSLLLCFGCGQSGPANYNLSGTVSFKGNPVPSGEVFLRPEVGPGGFAIIKDGKYETIDGRGFQGGLSKITFHGFEKTSYEGGIESGGGDLFPPHTVEVDLPKEDFVYDIEVPSK